MAKIELRGVVHAYAERPLEEEDYALKRLDLTWDDGRAYALLGPSGCGKTTLLNIISGLLRPSSGSIVIDGIDVTARPPERRNIAQVFQFPVIYDMMSVFDNLAFPLRNRRVDRVEINERVEEVAALLELTSELRRRASGLSADVKQRISLGRGLVRKDVAAVLLDEPLTVIDPHMKWLLRRKLKQIHEELRVTLVYVTHDQTEALTLADQVVVMNEGRVVQQGTPQELFERPAHTFVGYFIGSPGMNLLPCSIEDGAAIVEGQRVHLDPGACARAKERARGGEILLGARPELLERAAEGDSRAVRVEVALVEELGSHLIVTARMGARTLAIKLPEGERVAVGQALWITFPPRWTTLYVGGQAVS